MAEKIFTIGLNADDYLATAKSLKIEIDELSKSQKELKKSGETSTNDFIENEVALKSLKTQYNEVKKVMGDYNAKQKDTVKITDEVNAIMGNEVKTISDAKNQTKQLNKIKQNLNVNNKEEAKLLRAVNSKIDENTKFLRDNGSAEDKRILNIGNYASALQGVNPKLTIFINSGQKMVQGLKTQKMALEASNKSLKMFRIALVATGIGAIVVLLGALVGAFLKTQKGIDAVNQVLTPLKIVMESLWGVAEKLGEKLVVAFSSPKKLLKDMLDFLEGQVTNRIKAFGDIWSNVWKGEWSKVGDDILTIGTGVENLTGKVKDMASATNDMLDEAWTRGKKIADLDIQISTAKMTQGFAVAKLNRLLKEQELIAKDTNKSAKERNDAINLAKELSVQKLTLEKNILKLQQEKLLEEQKSNDTKREGSQEYYDLLAKEEDLKTKAQAEEMKFLGSKNTLIKQEQSKAINNLKKQHTEVMQNYKIEIETYKEKNKEILAKNKELNDKVVNAKLKVLTEINRLEKLTLEKQFKFGLIKKNVYDLEKLKLENNYHEQVSVIRTEWSNKQDADEQVNIEKEKAKKAIDLEIELQELELAENSKFEKKQAIDAIHKKQELDALTISLENENLTKEQFKKKADLIDKKYKRLEIKNEKDLAKVKGNVKMQELSINQGFAHQMGAIAEGIFGKNKAVSAGVALVDTYVGAQKAYLSQMTMTPDAPIRAYIAMASAIVVGLGNVKNIMSAGKNGGGARSNNSGVSRPTSSRAPVTSTTATSSTATAQPSNVINNYNSPSATIRVVNVARDTTDLSNQEIMTENFAND